MKGDINNRLLTTDMRPYSASVAVGVKSQDYLITTMKLRDKVLASKPQKPNSSCKLIRNMRSAPPFQNRNLDNYPMPYNREDAVRSARGQRAEKRYNAMRMTKSRAESGLMKEYSKQMFDFSVNTVHKNGSINKVDTENGRIPVRSKSEADCHDVLGTTGPTPDGSALHNRRQKVLNSIRIRPHTECQTKFRHERATSSSIVQNAICDKNRRYRVRSVTESSLRPGSHYGNVSLAGSDFIFIPVDQSSNVNGWMTDERLNSRRITMESSLSESNETDSLDATFGKDPFDDFDDSYTGKSIPNNQSRELKTPSPYSRTLLPPSVSNNMRLVSLDEASASESEEEKVEAEVEVKKPEPPPPPPPQPKSRARKKVPEPEPEPEPVKVKLILKGPHCWVDDATITSEPSEHGDVDCPDGANPTSGVQPDMNAEKQNSAQRLDIASKTKALMKGAITANSKPAFSAILKQPNQNAMKEAFDKALQNNVQSPTNAIENIGDMNKHVPNTNGIDNGHTDDNKGPENEETEEEIYLPPFLCPSSEKKSREAALKDWLAKSCFRTAHKGVPVV